MSEPAEVNWKQIVDKGVEMRAAQKKYFRTRTSAAMLRAKSLEREFDRMAEEGSTATGATLFGQAERARSDMNRGMKGEIL